MLGLLATAGVALQSCEKDNDDVVPQHDTTYKFSLDDQTAIDPNTSKVPASADSASVRNVYLEAVGDFSPANNVSMNYFVEKSMKPIFAASKGKAKGRGVLNPKSINPSDSTWLVQNGWTVQR